ncbi:MULTISPECIES: CheR family methyltransferase [Cyanophyceae]|uniref:CheR family methyltransferase n=1 Tax=Cyanophyceae TaxID=3028117 RepID=UPI001689E324|nr:CheR family methyltransferase [Trichocoleus sp. FACHB-69]MBD1931554.1 PAS domain-containing protein [Trichocoleus sp. FACHB-69]
MTSNQPFEQPTSESTGKASDTEQQDDVLFPIVGMAASAGGLEAFIDLLRHLPIDTGMAFVLIQHLSPDHKSLLTEILARETKMPVSEVKNGVAVEPNQVYIIPPNTKMILSQGMLQLAPREKVLGKYMPGDAFFTSLATERGTKAIAVVLSGGDGDGSLGLTEIKAAGGVTFAQCEGTAKFDSMPNTAVATGNVDFILPPQKIAEELAKLSRHPLIAHRSSPISVDNFSQSEDVLSIIFALLKSSTGVDFSDYKPNTLARRMQRRMLLYKLERLEDYAQYLKDHPAEVKALYEEILIHVTSFFRDSEAFQQLKEQVFPTITQNKSEDAPIRIWVAGCSTGEEVYSIAICLLEFLRDTSRQPIQIFATDISETAINKARSGVYQENQMVEVSPERRQRFFNKLENGGYQISKVVRELCIFARQDLGSDPPFSNLDLVSCRNVLIYLGEALQQRVMPSFHYSLNARGFLWLGTSESTGKFSGLFTLIDRKYRFYAKKLTVARPIFSFVTSQHPVSIMDSPKRINEITKDNFNLQKETDQLILNRYTPVGVVINEKMDVLQLRGKTDLYLRLPSGTPSFNVLKMVQDDLLLGLRTAVYQAQQQDVLVRKEGLQMVDGDRSKFVNIEVIPFKNDIAQERYFLVLFEEATAPIRHLNPIAPEDLEQNDLEQEIGRLKQELATAIQEQAAAHEYLQAALQEQEHTNQDLKVANEEILSSNEELQSTNEELETAKEEIQATNEELQTTNEELRSRNLELHAVNNDLINLLASSHIPILMLTNDLRVRRFTPMAQKLFNFIPTDVGRPFSDIRTTLELPDLEPLILEVIETLSPKELEVQTQAGYWYNLRIRPYRTTENRIDGAVVVLIDIDALKRSATTLETARKYAEAIVETVQMPLLVLDNKLRVNRANRSFYETFQVSSLETIQSSIFEIGNGQWDLPTMRSLLEDTFANDTPIANFEVEHCFEQIGQKTVRLTACRILQAGDVQMLLLAIEDISQQKQFEAEKSQLLVQEQSARQQAETANQSKDDFLSNLSHELRNPLNTILGWAQLLSKKKLDEATVTRALEVIERSARAQSQLIEDLLDVSRINSGKLQLNTRPLDLALIVNAAIESIQLAAETKNIQVTSQLDSALIVGDSDRLQQVLWNLLTNAIKFTSSGGRVEVTLTSVQNHAQIRVCDTGRGIGAELLPYVFDRFRQGDASSSKATQGLGLGLSIVWNIVELHGGTVQAESLGEAQGTTMTVRLLLRSLPPSQLEPVEPDVPSDAVPSLGGLQILVVDDDSDICNFVTWILENAGAEVGVATSAKEAIASLTKTPNRYDVLLSDIGMPENDGYWLIRQVRGFDAETGGQIPAAALTAYASDRDRQQAIAAGFQAHLAKPIDPSQLIFTVANLVVTRNTSA